MMKFSTTAEEFRYIPGDKLDLAVTLGENLYNGVKSLRINLADMRPSGIDYDEYLRQIRLYECISRGEEVDIDDSCIPDRETLAKIYRIIRASGEICFDSDTICLRLGMPESYCRVMLALDIMNEMGLAKVSRLNGFIKADIINISGKVNIADSAVMRRITAMNKSGGKQDAV